MSHPTIVYGAASFWNASDIDYAKQVLPALERLGIKHIDTARGYGESEAILGQLNAPEKFVIDTKIPGFGPKTQTREAVFAAEKASFDALKTDQVRDINLPSLRACTSSSWVVIDVIPNNKG